MTETLDPGEATDLSDEERGPSILAKLNHARRELLDLSTRNRLLSAPRNNKRAKTVEVVDELADEVFRILVTEGRSMTFLAQPEDEDVLQPGELTEPSLAASYTVPPLAMPDEEDEGNGTAARHLDRKLQTKLESAFLQKRLLALHYDGRSALEEQGFNILYLAVGFLKWIDPNQKKERFAPLILIPITLDRTSAQSRFKAEYSGEEITTNLSLNEKLLSSFGVELPPLPDADDLVPSEYCKVVATKVQNVPGWEVLPNDMLLGIFSFSKLLMHRDLNPENWPDGRSLVDHSILRGLLGEGLSEEAHYDDDVDVDTVTDPDDLPHVMDADSSQTMAIEEVRHGKNLVIQGPPGTGKSQTIANLIAAAVSADQSVLFVAEKRAALDVVKRRLDDIGLGDMCLELHSHKARKKVVLEELDRTMQLGAPQVAGGRTADELRQARDRLNQHARLMHTPLEPSGVTPFRAIGALARLRGSGVSAPDFLIEAAAHWTVSEFSERLRVTQEMASFLPSLGPPRSHAWRGVGVATMLPMDVERLSELVTRTEENLLQCEALSAALSAVLDSPGSTLAQARQLLRFAEAVSVAPRMDPIAMAHDAWHERRSDIKSLLDEGKKLKSARQSVSAVLSETAWAENLGDIRKTYARKGSSLFRMLSGEYRAARSELTSYCRGKPPEPKAAVRVLDKLREGQNALSHLGEESDLGEEAFGQLWAHDQSRWAELDAIAAWDAECASIDLPSDHRRVPQRLENAPPLSTLMDESDQALQRVEIAVEDLFKRLQIDCELAFGEHDVNAVPISALLSRVQAWKDNPAGVHQWITFRDRDEGFDQLQLGPIRDLYWEEKTEPESLEHILSYARHEAIVSCAWKENAELRGFDGGEHGRVVTDFQDLELKRFELARAEVAHRHFEGVPKGGAIGEMALLRREINKKRRHLPIRKLVENAGHAIAKIKPVFMMSPMSVAQYLAPGTLTFDLLVIDEASQVRPVEALGVVARCAQAVVVGDKKQLPPTRFFDSLVELAEDEEDQDDGSFQAGDLESILALCEAQGLPSKMLRWHYRSRHESLIAVSNHAFYDDKLFIIPSSSPGDDLGLAFHHLPHAVYDRGGSRTNRVEAQAVAEAVIAHAEDTPTRTLGVGTFSVAQRDAILDEIELRRRGRPDLENFFLEGGAEPFFVKNLETIQGDERDVILLSIGYGPDDAGYMAMNFGPLTNEGGQRRLNVLISRARERMDVFSSITADSIDLSRTSSEGVGALKTFLRYAQTGVLGAVEATERPPDSEFEEEVARALVTIGHDVVAQVGTAGFFVDLAIRDPSNPGRYALGVECDGATYHSSRSARDRDRLRQGVLESRGWSIHRVWSTDWFKDPEAELRKIQIALQAALANASNTEERLPSLPERNHGGALERESALGLIEAVESTPYIEANVYVDARTELHTVPTSVLTDVVVAIAEIEGPIHEDEIVKRVTSLWGLSRAGSRIQKAVKGAVAFAERTGRVEAAASFVRIPGASLDTPRNRANVESQTLLKAEMLPHEEIRLTAAEVVRTHVGATAAEVAMEVTRVFGFKRMGPDLKKTIGAEIRRMLKDEVIEIRDDRVYLP
jgi:very-short-patch-repair endonuclease